MHRLWVKDYRFPVWSDDLHYYVEVQAKWICWQDPAVKSELSTNPPRHAKLTSLWLLAVHQKDLHRTKQSCASTAGRIFPRCIHGSANPQLSPCRSQLRATYQKQHCCKPCWPLCGGCDRSQLQSGYLSSFAGYASCVV